MDILLKDILESNKKTELYKMAKEFGIEKISKLKKEELLQLVCTYLLNPDQMKKFLLNTGEQDFELFCRIADGERILIDINTETLLFQCGYVFEDKENRFVIPYDVKRVFQNLNHNELKREKKQKDWFCKCMEIAGSLYGIIPEDILLKLFNSRTEFHISEVELLWNLRNAHEQHPEYLYDSGVFLFSNRFSKEQLKKLLEKQKGKTYYILSHNEIKEFSEKGYLSNNTSYRKFILFLEEKISLTRDKVNSIVKFLWISNSRDEDLIATVKHIVDQIEFATEDQCVDLIKRIADTYNHTRMLAHRGHTLVEIIRKQPTLRNMISIMGDTEAVAIIAEIESYLKSKGLSIHVPQVNKEMRVIRPVGLGFSKIYPNEPCYCGSGKKYKKCCGRLK